MPGWPSGAHGGIALSYLICSTHTHPVTPPRFTDTPPCIAWEASVWQHSNDNRNHNVRSRRSHQSYQRHKSTICSHSSPNFAPLSRILPKHTVTRYEAIPSFVMNFSECVPRSASTHSPDPEKAVGGQNCSEWEIGSTSLVFRSWTCA